MLKMAKQSLKIFRCLHGKIFKVCLVIFEHYERKGWCCKEDFIESLKLLSIFGNSLGRVFIASV